MSFTKNIKIIFLVIFLLCCCFILYMPSILPFQISKYIYLDTQRKVFDQTCNCSISSTMANKLRYYGKWKWVKDSQESVCSSDATALGPHQKVVSFSVFLLPKHSALTSDSIHFNGIIIKVKELPKFYPNWKIRIYSYSHRHWNKHFCELTCSYPDDVFICDIENLPRLGNISGIIDGRIWRFIPLIDPTVEIFISRDIESSFSERELVAVDEWIKSNKTFHAMRDHPWHNIPILGGLWGARSDRVNTSMKTKYQEAMLKNGTSNGSFALKMYDQDFLGIHFYPTFKNDLISHDSYFCEYFKDAKILPFPVKRINSTDFVANYLFTPNLYPIPITNECPVACRPLYGQNWTFC